MNRTFVKVSSVSAIAALASAAGLLVAGPLNPPSGPVTSTYKTLAEVEPRLAINATNTPGALGSIYKITQPGSYYLTGNITANFFNCGIEVASNDVTIDLNGFAIIGTNATGGPSGIIANSAFNNVTIRNGSVRSWPAYGLKLDNISYLRLENVSAAGNSSAGFYLGDQSTITGCVATGNLGGGFHSTLACSFSNCTAHSNTGAGFTVGEGCSLDGSSAAYNSADGAYLAQNCHVRSCVFNHNSKGLETGYGCVVESTTACSNGGPGIYASNGSVVHGCTASENSGHGIRALQGCLILDNNCSDNTGSGNAGIDAAADGNRIEGNVVERNPIGVRAESASNIINRNTARANTLNWSLVAGNLFGPIMDRTVPGSAAVSGNSAASSLGTTDPNANFSY